MCAKKGVIKPGITTARNFSLETSLIAQPLCFTSYSPALLWSLSSEKAGNSHSGCLLEMASGRALNALRAEFSEVLQVPKALRQNSLKKKTLIECLSI